MEKVLLLIGDSNVRRSVTSLGALYSRMVQYIPCRNMSELEQSLMVVEAKYSTVVLSVLTNIVVDAGDKPKDGNTRDSAIQGALSKVVALLQ